ncbi:hypothetical protein ACJ73_08570, partial [Blastomyces percursus]
SSRYRATDLRTSIGSSFNQGVNQGDGWRCRPALLAGLRPFPKCRLLPGRFRGACGNCKWRDHAIRSSVRDDDRNTVEVIEIPDTDDKGDNGGRRLRIITDIE